MIPGAISYKLFSIWTGNHSEYGYRSFIDIFIFSIADYLSFDIIRILRIAIYQLPPPTLSLEILLSENSTLDFTSIVAATLIGIPVAAFAACVREKDWIAKLGITLGFTQVSGYPSVWDDVWPHNDKWVYVRDHKLNLTYFGYIDRVSDSRIELRELYLKDVSVYNENSEILYEIPHLFLTREATDISIEIAIEDSSTIQINESEGREQNGQ